MHQQEMASSSQEPWMATAIKDFHGRVHEKLNMKTKLGSFHLSKDTPQVIILPNAYVVFIRAIEINEALTILYYFSCPVTNIKSSNLDILKCNSKL